MKDSIFGLYNRIMTTHRKGICGTFSAMKSSVFDESLLYSNSEAALTKNIFREPIVGLARDRWNVRKMKNEQSDNMAAFYQKQKKFVRVVGKLALFLQICKIDEWK